MSVCRSCGASILWATTAAGKSMPLDAEPSPDGNVEVTEDRHRLLVIAVHPSPPIFAETLYMPHHATCPDAADWKQR